MSVLLNNPSCDNNVNLYYDPFNADEEEDYLEAEMVRIAREVDRVVDGLFASAALLRGGGGGGGQSCVRSDATTNITTTTLSSSSASSPFVECHLDFPLQVPQLVRIVDAMLLLLPSPSPPLWTESGSCDGDSCCCCDDNHNNNNNNNKQLRLSFRHWGLGNRGVAEVVRLWTTSTTTTVPVVRELSLASCGITSSGLRVLLESLATTTTTTTTTTGRSSPSPSSSLPSLPSSPPSRTPTPPSYPSLRSLDLRRNNLRHDQDAVAEMFREYLPTLSPNLQSLNLAGTGLTMTATQAVLEGVFMSSSCPIRHLDLSNNNFASLYDILMIVAMSMEEATQQQYRKNSQSRQQQQTSIVGRVVDGTPSSSMSPPSASSSQLERLVLVSDSSTTATTAVCSTYLDCRKESHVALLERLADILLVGHDDGNDDDDGNDCNDDNNNINHGSAAIHRNLTMLGPLTMLPLDLTAAVTDDETQQLQRHRRGGAAINRIHFALHVNACRASLSRVLLSSSSSEGRNAAVLLPLLWAGADSIMMTDPLSSSSSSAPSPPAVLRGRAAISGSFGTSFGTTTTSIQSPSPSLSTMATTTAAAAAAAATTTAALHPLFSLSNKNPSLGLPANAASAIPSPRPPSLLHYWIRHTASLIVSSSQSSS